MKKIDQLEIELRIAVYMAKCNPKKELYWKQIAQDIQFKIKKLK